MSKILCGLGLALTLAISGCAPGSGGASPTPQATSTTTTRAGGVDDIANVDLAGSGQTRDAGITSQSLPENGKKVGSDNPGGTPSASKALEGHLAEEQLAALALQRAQSGDVKEVAQMIAKEHMQAEAELRAAAGTSLPVVELSPEHQKLKDRLEGLSGPAFDKAYIDAMVDGHEKTLNLYQTQAKDAPTTTLREYFSKTAPVIKKHLDHCKSVQSNLG